MTVRMKQIVSMMAFRINGSRRDAYGRVCSVRFVNR
jgi:hypothetical protein